MAGWDGPVSLDVLRCLDVVESNNIALRAQVTISRDRSCFAAGQEIEASVRSEVVDPFMEEYVVGMQITSARQNLTTREINRGQPARILL